LTRPAELAGIDACHGFSAVNSPSDGLDLNEQDDDLDSTTGLADFLMEADDGDKRPSFDPYPSLTNIVPLTCKWDGCSSTRTFTRTADLLRHIRMAHVQQRAYICPQKGCSRGFSRKDTLAEHRRRVHGNIEEREYETTKNLEYQESFKSSLG
jgi:uncharacterized Zn-finger protein